MDNMVECQCPACARQGVILGTKIALCRKCLRHWSVAEWSAMHLALASATAEAVE